MYDLRVFCTTFGLDNYGTKEQLKTCLIQHYQIKFTALRCIEGYSVINENALQDLKARFGRKRLIVRDLVKSILGLMVPDEKD